MNTSTGLTRRHFIRSNLAAALAASAFPSIIPASALGRGGAAPPSERVAVGCIGVGERGHVVMTHFLQQQSCQVTAVCDVKQDALDKAKAAVDSRYRNQDCQTYGDFRQLVARKDTDAVLIASTDHWHVLHALAAIAAGKDVYVEKPLGFALAEDQALRQAVHAQKRVFQFGTQQRSDRKFRLACELVRNGCIGKLKHINLWAPGSRPGGSTRPVPPPATLNYDSWLGPAAFRPYTEDLAAWDLRRKTWWFISDFALGWIAGWGIHPMDIALWGAGDLAGGNVEIAGKGRFPTEGACNTATTWDVDFTFERGLTMKFVGAPNGAPGEPFAHKEEWTQRYGNINGHGTAFEGSDGWVLVDRAHIQMQPESLIDLNPDSFKTKLVRSTDHVGSFLAAVKARAHTVSPIEEAVLADAFCHVADIALRLNRKLTYDVKAEHFRKDDAANQRLKLRPMRAPWKI
ncbi:MAG: Gfo/Idh/MocA family oxidoreductase [Verrucomicrobiota bacterium]